MKCARHQQNNIANDVEWSQPNLTPIPVGKCHEWCEWRKITSGPVTASECYKWTQSSFSVRRNSFLEQFNISRRARAGATDPKRHIAQPKPQSPNKKEGSIRQGGVKKIHIQGGAWKIFFISEIKTSHKARMLKYDFTCCSMFLPASLQMLLFIWKLESPMKLSHDYFCNIICVYFSQ